jgi:hypothetical protein
MPDPRWETIYAAIGPDELRPETHTRFAFELELSGSTAFSRIVLATTDLAADPKLAPTVLDRMVKHLDRFIGNGPPVTERTTT